MIRKRQNQNNGSHPLAGRKLYIPRMGTVGAEAMAAAFRSIGVDAEVPPRSDENTLALAARYTTGEECLPQRVTLGDFLNIMTQSDFNPGKTAFFLPTSSGPCRFGQYAPFLKKLLRDLGHEKSLVFSPTSSNGYEGIAEHVSRFLRTAWRAIVVSDVLRKLLLMFRPYEKEAGEADKLYDRSLAEICSTLANGSLQSGKQLKRLTESMESVRDGFLNIPLREPAGSRPLIGLVGEIFIRLNSFSNQNLVRRVEAAGGEVWIADISEWVWYTNLEQERKLREAGKGWSLPMAGARARRWIQERDEKALLAPFGRLFKRREETPVQSLLSYSQPYLPARKALGEMTLNVGKVVAFYRAGCDGVIDASPFTCMNGIVTEAVYPVVSRDHHNLPIRIFYFDGIASDLDRDLEIFMDLVKSYRQDRLSRA